MHSRTRHDPGEGVGRKGDALSRQAVGKNPLGTAAIVGEALLAAEIEGDIEAGHSALHDPQVA